MQDVQGIVHRHRRVLLQVLPAITASRRASLGVARAAHAKDVRTDGASVRGEEFLAVYETHEVTFVEETPSCGACTKP